LLLKLSIEEDFNEETDDINELVLETDYELFFVLAFLVLLFFDLLVSTELL
jgi:hypothetical protein